MMKRWLILFLLLWASSSWATVDPVSRWNFEEGSGTTVSDTGSGGNTGTLQNSATRAAGNVGSYALSTDGTFGNVVTVDDPGSGNLDFGTSSFSLSAWFKTADTINERVIVNKKTSGSCDPGDEGYDIILNADEIRGRICDGIAANQYSATWTGQADNAWHHVVIIVDRGTNLLKIYGDGVQIGSSTDITGIGSVSNATRLTIAGTSVDTFVFNGLIDDVRVYNRVITPTEITDMFNQTEDPGTPASDFFARRR